MDTCGGFGMTTSSSTKDTQKIFSLDWYRTLPERAAHAFWASFLGWALDAFDFQAFSLVLTAIAATFALSRGQAGIIATASLVVSALGGAVAFGAIAYGLCLIALLFLPETRGKKFVALD